MPKRFLLALSPTAQCIALAARIYGYWNEFRLTGGRRLLAEVLEEWSETRPGREVLVLQPRVVEPKPIRVALERYLATGGQVLWLAPADEGGVTKSCVGLEGVKLIQGETFQQAFESVFPPRARELDPKTPIVVNYLRYKINLCFMRQMHPEPIGEALKLLGTHGGAFSERSIPKRDLESLRRFEETDFPYFEGKMPVVLELKERVLRYARTDLSVLVLGETGTGKEAVAFYLHEFSERRGRPFVCINCAGLDENTLRSELFGHVRGAFTGAVHERKGLVERASGGTFFLDELGDMPLSVQADLLRFLQTRRFRRMGSDEERTANIRFVAAGQPDILEKMAEGEFREDLYYRIAEVTLHTPRLADIPEDIPRIARNILYRQRRPEMDESLIREVAAYFDAAADELRAYAWPGNVRELASLVRRRLFAGDDVLPELRRRTSTGRRGGIWPRFKPIDSAEDIEPLDTIRARYLEHVMASRGGLTQKEIAARLGVSVNTLKAMLKGKNQPQENADKHR